MTRLAHWLLNALYVALGALAGVVLGRAMWR